MGEERLVGEARVLRRVLFSTRTILEVSLQLSILDAYAPNSIRDKITELVGNATNEIACSGRCGNAGLITSVGKEPTKGVNSGSVRIGQSTDVCQD